MEKIENVLNFAQANFWIIFVLSVLFTFIDSDATAYDQGAFGYPPSLPRAFDWPDQIRGCTSKPTLRNRLL